jgi:N,N'-diacetylchitobiose transport system permease protein
MTRITSDQNRDGPSGVSRTPLRHKIWRSATRGFIPLVAILPTLIAFAVLMGYPFLKLLWISVQKYDYLALISHRSVWAGLDNYVNVLTRQVPGVSDLPTVVFRTTAFMFACVFCTILFGTLMALLMERINKWFRLMLTSAMVLAWSIPALTGSVLFQWLFDSKLGVVNWAISSVGVFGNYQNHDWFATGLATFAICTLLIVWQAMPFVALSVYAGLLVVPKDLSEAARVDGATERDLFWHIQLPSLRGLFMMLIFLSVIWDFKVFTQLYAMGQGGPAGQTVTLAIYTYVEGIAEGQYGYAAAASVVMMMLLLLVLLPYVRNMINSQEDL